MLELLADNTSTSQKHQVAQTYKSCVTFFRNAAPGRHLAAMWEAAGFHTDSWMKAQSFSQLLALVIRGALQSGLGSPLRIVYADNGTVDVYLGEPIASYSDDSVRSAMLREAFNALYGGLGARSYQIEAQSLDDKVKLAVARVSSGGRGETPSPIKKDALDLTDVGFSSNSATPRNHIFSHTCVDVLVVTAIAIQRRTSACERRWWPVLNQYASSSNKPKPEVLRTSNVQAITEVLSALATTDLEVARIYALVAPFAEYLSFAHRIASTTPRMSETDAQKRCSKVVHSLFGLTLHNVMKSEEEEDEEVEVHVLVNAMWDNVREECLNETTIAKGLELDKDAITQAKPIMHGILVTPCSGRPAESETDAAFREPYTQDFLANIIRYSRLTGRHVDLGLGVTVPLDGRFEILPEHMRPDFCYPLAAEPCVNYATMGVMAAEMMFNASRLVPPQGNSTTGPSDEERGKCVSAYAKKLGLDVNPDSWEAHLRTRWAMETALRSAKRLPNAQRSVLFERFFFVRFGRLYCGEQFTSPLEFATKSSSLFATAFDCDHFPPPNC
ncbi:uncharacterized protein LOC144159873 [Haemaphysalis longicornis]